MSDVSVCSILNVMGKFTKKVEDSETSPPPSSENETRIYYD